MKKLHIGFMKDLQNWEFHSLYENIINLMDKEQLENDYIKKALERIKLHEEKFIYALTAKRKSKYSIANQELTRERTDYLISL